MGNVDFWKTVYPQLINIHCVKKGSSSGCRKRRTVNKHFSKIHWHFLFYPFYPKLTHFTPVDLQRNKLYVWSVNKVVYICFKKLPALYIEFVVLPINLRLESYAEGISWKNCLPGTPVKIWFFKLCCFNKISRLCFPY